MANLLYHSSRIVFAKNIRLVRYNADNLKKKLGSLLCLQKGWADHVKEECG